MEAVPGVGVMTAKTVHGSHFLDRAGAGCGAVVSNVVAEVPPRVA
jgi:hypothetical protein